jgi:hypothetical protein
MIKKTLFMIILLCNVLLVVKAETCDQIYRRCIELGWGDQSAYTQCGYNKSNCDLQAQLENEADSISSEINTISNDWSNYVNNQIINYSNTSSCGLNSYSNWWWQCMCLAWYRRKNNDASNLDCILMDDFYCQTIFGMYSIYDSTNKKCSCKKGTTLDQNKQCKLWSQFLCTYRFGDNVTYKDWYCYCSSGYILNEEKTACELKKVISVIEYTPVNNTTTNIQTNTVWSFYSAELQWAYDYAYQIGITTVPSIDNADMKWTLIRSHMAKMMVNYARWVLNKVADTSIICNFTDILNQTEELRWYIIEACQMGLMWVWLSKFDPNWIVTRAELGTVLSRALYWNTYNSSTPYYANHLQALKIAGIMTNIDNPKDKEVRWYVMLMMQRASTTLLPPICQTAENILSCGLDLDTCPSECENEL